MFWRWRKPLNNDLPDDERRTEPNRRLRGAVDPSLTVSPLNKKQVEGFACNLQPAMFNF
jgi:hypothetical protein